MDYHSLQECKSFVCVFNLRCILLNIDLSSETNKIHCHCLILLMYCLLLNAQWQIFNEYSGRSHIQQMNDY